MPPSISTRRSEFFAGARATLPLILGAIPFGIIYGAVAVANGLSPAAAQGMSLFVFAGSAQFIAASLVGDGLSVGLIILTTFVVNLRHALYAASLAPFMKHLPQRWLIPLGFWLTDESYAATIARFNAPDDSPYKHWFYFGSAAAMYTNWQICTLIGILVGQQIPDPQGWGLDFAMVVTFIGIIMPLIRNRPALVSVIVAGVVSVLANGLPNKLGLMVAALLGIAAGVLAEIAWPVTDPLVAVEENA
ncbi:MAG: AzlC family ABC transporter permease [Anaerolineae bacterium]|nr:AzlC family ABC transporter permease [Anaerolineae bacterium]